MELRIGRSEDTPGALPMDGFSQGLMFWLVTEGTKDVGFWLYEAHRFWYAACLASIGEGEGRWCCRDLARRRSPAA